MIKPAETAGLCTSQLTLPFQQDEYYLQASLTRMLGKDIAIAVTDNRTSMLSINRDREQLSLRIHRIFLDADETVIKAVADFIKNRKTSRPVIRAFIRRHSSTLKPRTTKPKSLRTDGACHCLATLFTKVNTEYFQGKIAATITWGRRSEGRKARRVTLGSYCRDSHTIRVNPLLDRQTVPGYFLEFIIYHEMLHASLGIMVTNGRRKVHTREFRYREKQFTSYNEAISWEKEHLIR